MSSEQQGTDQWFQDRAGRITGSRFVDVTARNKKTGGKLKAWGDLAETLAAERFNGHYNDPVSAASLDHGNALEPFARSLYELETGNVVEQVGFLVHPDYDFAGCSPDGLIGSDGAIEIKCPRDQRIHLARWRNGMEDEYLPQCQGLLWVTGRQWVDWCSYDPRTRKSHMLYIKRVERDEQFITQLASCVFEMEVEIQRLIAELEGV